MCDLSLLGWYVCSAFHLAFLRLRGVLVGLYSVSKNEKKKEKKEKEKKEKNKKKGGKKGIESKIR